MGLSKLAHPNADAVKTFIAILALLLAAPAWADYFDTVRNDAPILYFRLADSPCASFDFVQGYAASPTNGCAPNNGRFDVDATSTILCQQTGLIASDANTCFVGHPGGAGSSVAGTNAQLVIPTPTTLYGAFTFETWARPDHSTTSSTDNQSFFGNRPGLGFGIDAKWQDTTHARIDIGTQLPPTGHWCIVSHDIPFVFSSGTIYHVVLTGSTTDYHFYVNGSLVETGAYTSSPCTPAIWDSTLGSPNLATVGSTASVEPLYGASDEFAVYDYELSAARILDHYNCGNSSTSCDNGSNGTNPCFPLTPTKRNWPFAS